MINISGIQFHILEIIVLPFALAFMPAFMLSNLRLKISNREIFYLYLIFATTFLASILLSYFNALNKILVLKSFLKWIEIFGISLLTFIYISSYKRFKHIWWLLVLSIFLYFSLETIEALKVLSKNLYAGLRSLPAYSILFLLVLLIPFSKRCFIIICIWILLILSIVSLSRGVWIGVFASITYIFFRSRHKKEAILLFLSIILSLILMLFVFSNVREAFYLKIQGSLSLQSASNKERLGMAIVALSLFFNYPLTGIGAENFPVYLTTKEVPEFISAQDPERLTPHNFFLQVAAENGIMGLIAILGCIWTSYRMLFTCYSKSPYIYGLRLLFITILISLMLGYVAGPMRVILALFFGLCLGTLRVQEIHKS